MPSPAARSVWRALARRARPGARWAPVLLAVSLVAAACGPSAPDHGAVPASSSSTSAAPPAGGSSSAATPATRDSDRGSGSPLSSGAPTTPSGSSRSGTGASEQPLELPRGGRTVFPRYRLVGYVGAPGAPSLGRLGTGPLDERVDEIERRAQPFAQGREVLPVMELVATVVRATPGRDGLYRTRFGDDVIQHYLDVARSHRALLLLDIQPGRAHVLDEVKHYRHWLQQPDVGLALDPEWEVGPTSVPGKVFGHTTGEELDEVSRYVAGIVQEHDLPQKVVVYHQLNRGIVRDPQALRPRREVAMVQSVDGIGVPADKEQTWRRVVRDKPTFVHPGFKLFFDEDAQAGGLMTPAQVMALRPTPEYVLYE